MKAKLLTACADTLIFRKTALAVSVAAIVAGLTGCGDRYDNPYETGDRELASNRPNNSGPNTNDPNAPSRLSGLFQADTSLIESLSPDAPIETISQMRILAAQSSSGQYLDILLCNTGGQGMEIQRLPKAPGTDDVYDLPAEIFDVGQIQVDAYNGEYRLNLVRNASLDIPMVPASTPEIFTFDGPREATVTQSSEVCGNFAQANARVESSAYGKFGFVADYGIHLVDLTAPRGLQYVLGEGEVTAKLLGDWYNYNDYQSPRDLSSPQLEILRCTDSALTFQLSGRIEEGDWRLSVSHQLSSPVMCPTGVAPIDPPMEETPPPMEEMPPPMEEMPPPVEEVPPPMEEMPPPEEEMPPPEEEVPPPMEEMPPPEEEMPPPVEEMPPPMEEMPPPVEEVPPPIEEIPPPVEEEYPEETPLEPPVAVGEAECGPAVTAPAESLTGRWQLDNADFFLSFGLIPPEFADRLQNSLFLVDQQTSATLAVCEIPELEVSLVRNGDQLESEQLSELVGAVDGIDVSGLAVKDADTLNIKTSLALGGAITNLDVPLNRQVDPQQSVCWDSSYAAEPLPAATDICASTQYKGLRLVFQLEQHMMAMDFALPSQPEVGTYALSKAYPVTLLSDRFVASGLPAQQQVESGALIIESIGESSVSGRVRLDMPGGEEVTVSFSSYLSRVVEGGDSDSSNEQ